MNCHWQFFNSFFFFSLNFMFSKKATEKLRNLHRRFDVYLVSVKSTVKTLSFFVAFLENMNFNNVWRAAYS
jgi:hypothetical protein